MRTLIVMCAIGAMLSIAGGVEVAHAGLVVDQQCSGASNGGNSAKVFSLAQSFTPTTNAIDTAELLLANTDQLSLGAAVVSVRVRAGNPSGTILGSSAPVSLAHGSFGMVPFSFSPAIALTPGSVYVLELVYDTTSAGNPAWSLSFSCYAGGSAFIDGNPAGTSDWIFREGVTVPSADEIITQFDEAVGDGELVGTGPGGSADGRLSAMRSKLETIASLISGNDVPNACEEIASALAKTDGNPRPPDFVSGAAAAELAAALRALAASIACP